MARPKKQVVKENPLAESVQVQEVAQVVALTRSDYRAISDATEGWFEPAEADLLVKVAAERAARAEEHIWIEIGSYCGKSTVLLAGELALFGEGALYAVDPHAGELSYPTHFVDGRMDAARLDQVGSTLEKFRATIQMAHLEPYVSEAVMPFTSFGTQRGFITLAFVDGLHDFGSVLADWDHLKPMLADEATVCFHDFSTWAGPHQVVTDAVAIGELEIVEQADSLVVCKFLGAK